MGLVPRLRRMPTLVVTPVLAVGLVGLPAVDTAPDAAPVEPELETVSLTGVDSAAAAAAEMPDEPGHDHSDEAGSDAGFDTHEADPADGGPADEAHEDDDFAVAATSEPLTTDPYRVVAVTWDDDDVEVDELNAWIRYRSGAGWSDWYPLPTADDHAPDPGSVEAAGQREATEPLVVPESDGVQVRVDTEDGVEVDDLRVDLIDPGESAADAVVGTADLGAAQAAIQPTIYTRADWGADESLRGRTVEYGQIQAAFVHHTVNSNDYSPADVPAIIRGIYAFHVKSRGWRDIGYNFLIDKWGRIWEGRYGGIDKPVTGAHTYGHNDDAFGASTIGTYTDTEPTPATLDAYARLFSWKLDMHGVDPLGKANLDGTVVNTISGHRDTYATACPGERLYAKLPQIRTATAALMTAGAPPASSTSPQLTATLREAAVTSGSGTVLTVQATGVTAGARVTLERAVVGKRWKTLRSAALDANGAVTFGLSPRKPRAYDFRVALSGSSARSAPARLTVMPKEPSVAVSLQPNRITSGEKARMVVTTSNVAVGTKVVVKRRVAGQKWTNARVARVDADGQLAFGFGPKRPRDYDLRAIVKTQPRLRSAPARLVVDPKPTATSRSTTTPTRTPVQRGSDVFARPGDGVFRMVGHGWGHGIGLSQWGARQAATQGVREPEITGTYYPGTTRSRSSANPVVKVLLTADTGTDVIARAEAGLKVRWTRSNGSTTTKTLPGSPGGCSAPWWRVLATGSDLAIQSLCGQDWRTWRSAAQVDGNRPVTFIPSDGMVDTPQRSGSGFTRKAYRGSLEAHRSGGSVRAVNAVPMESYLRSVVPNEMPSSWPTEALRAQTVAARSYALREMQDRTGYFDVYDTTSSQVYPGARLYDGSWRVTRSYETSAADAAVSATSGIHLTYGGRPALTMFSSSNGGVTAPGSQPYLVQKKDPWDAAATANTRLNWTDSISATQMERAFPQVGRLERIRVTGRQGVGDWGGRVLGVRLEGTRGVATVSGEWRIRSALGTNSTYFTFR